MAGSPGNPQSDKGRSIDKNPALGRADVSDGKQPYLPSHELEHSRLSDIDEYSEDPLPSPRPRTLGWVAGSLAVLALLIVGASLVAVNGAGGGGTTVTATVVASATPDGTATTPLSTQTGSAVTPTVSSYRPVTESATEASIQPLADCVAGWLPASGCTCCGTTLTCADGTVATFNPACGVGGGTKCTCAPVDPQCTQYPGCPFQCQQTGASCTP